MALMQVQGLELPRRLADIGFELQPGELLGVIGPNGAGKSSLLAVLAGGLPYRGDIRLCGQPLTQLTPIERARRIAYLPQQSSAAWALRVRDVIALGRLPWGDESEPQIRAAAAQTGVDEWLEVPVNQLSGGEQARVWLARLLAGEPMLMLADEPLASLDLYYQQRMLERLRAFARGERAVILSIHDLTLAASWCDRLLLLEAGRLLAVGTPRQVLTAEHIRLAYRVDAELDFTLDPPQLRWPRRLS